MQLRILYFWLVVMAIGATASFATMLFNHSIEWLHALFYWSTPTESFLPAVIILTPALGGAVVIFIRRHVAAEGRMHPEHDIEEMHTHHVTIHPRLALGKTLAAAFCIGSGGSVGSEGPVVQMGSALAALYAKCLQRLQTTEYHTFIACGAASAFATALHTPAAGILYALELVLTKITLKATIAVILATSIALLCARAIGDIPVLPVAHHQHTLFMPYSSYLAYLILGIAAGIVATMFIQTLHHSDKRCRTLRLNPYLMHMSAMLVVGAAYYGMIRVTGSCYVDGVGYTTIAMLLEEPALPGRYLILLLVAKLLLTTMTLGSGGTGGLFAPSLFVGAVLGAIFYMMLNPSLHLLDGQYLICVIAGMAGMVAAMTSTWLLPMVLMFEITHDPGILIPTMIVTLVARALRASLTPRTMYTYQI